MVSSEKVEKFVDRQIGLLRIPRKSGRSILPVWKGTTVVRVGSMPEPLVAAGGVINERPCVLECLDDFARAERRQTVHTAWSLIFT